MPSRASAARSKASTGSRTCAPSRCRPSARQGRSSAVTSVRSTRALGGERVARRGSGRRRRARCRPRSSAPSCRRRRSRRAPAAASMRAVCAAAIAACSSRRGVRARASQNSRRSSGTTSTRRPRAASRAPISSGERRLAGALGAEQGNDERALVHRAAGLSIAARAQPAAPADACHRDEDEIEDRRQPQPLVREQRSGDDVDDDPDGPVLDVLAAEQPLADHARRGRERVPPRHVGVGEALQEERRRRPGDRDGDQHRHAARAHRGCARAVPARRHRFRAAIATSPRRRRPRRRSAGWHRRTGGCSRTAACRAAS